MITTIQTFFERPSSQAARQALLGMGVYFVMWLVLVALSFVAWTASMNEISVRWLPFQILQGLVGCFFAFIYIAPIVYQRPNYEKWLLLVLAIVTHSFLHAYLDVQSQLKAFELTEFSFISVVLMSMATVGWVHGITAVAQIYIQRVDAHIQEKERNARLMADLHKAQLTSLQASLNPHFLFNALNSISALIVLKQSEKADMALTLLGDLLRESLDTIDKPQVPLCEELKLARLYLDIECLRFEDRLNLNWEIDPTCEHVIIPKFLFQPLLENIFKHSVRHTLDRVDVKISVQAQGNDTVALHIWNSLPAPAELQPSAKPKLGLSNTQARLDLFFDHKSQLHAEQRADGYHVHLILPCQ